MDRLLAFAMLLWFVFGTSLLVSFFLGWERVPPIVRLSREVYEPGSGAIRWIPPLRSPSPARPCHR